MQEKCTRGCCTQTREVSQNWQVMGSGVTLLTDDADTAGRWQLRRQGRVRDCGWDGPEGVDGGRCGRGAPRRSRGVIGQGRCGYGVCERHNGHLPILGETAPRAREPGNKGWEHAAWYVSCRPAVAQPPFLLHPPHILFLISPSTSTSNTT